MVAGVAGRIVRVTYARTMLDRVADVATSPSTTLREETLPPVVIDAIQQERLEELAGEWGEPDAGEPIEYERLRVAYERGAFELTVFTEAPPASRSGGSIEGSHGHQVVVGDATDVTRMQCHQRPRPPRRREELDL